MESYFKLKKYIKFIVGAVLLSWLLWFMFEGSKPKVKTEKVIRGDAVDAVPGTLTVESKTIIDISADIRGVVLKTHIDFGAQVKKGDILLELDDQDIRFEIERTEIELRAERQRLELPSDLEYTLQTMKEDLEESERKHKARQLSDLMYTREKRAYEKTIDSLKRKKISDSTKLKNLDISLKEKKVELEKSRIKAPDSGTINDIFSFPGELVTHGGVVAQLISDELRIEGKIGEEDFAGIKPGQDVTIRFLSYPDLYKGRVKQVLPTADPDTQQYKIYLNVDMPEGLLVPGLTGELSIIKAKRSNTLIIPRRALLGRYVLVVKDGLVELRLVKPGFLGLEKAEIQEGLEEGELIIIDELDQYKDGDKVRVEVLN